VRLVHRDIEHHIDFEQASSWLLVVEDPQQLYALISGLYAQLNGDIGKFVLSEGGKEISLPGAAYIVFEPFTINPNVSRTVFNKLVSNLKAVAFDEDHLDQTSELMRSINTWKIPLCRLGAIRGS
jgi:CRISPR type II-A-associated protein Csn2